MKIISIQILILFLLFLSFTSVSAQQPELLLKVINNNKVQKYNVNQNTSDFIYESKFDEIKEIKVSPNEKYIGLLETDYSNNKPINSLTIIDSKGNLVRILDHDVKFFEWDPSGFQIAFISGIYYEGGIGYRPTGVYVYNIEDDQLASIETPDFYPYRLNWISSDVENSIYFESLSPDPNFGIVKYNLIRRQLEKTPFPTIELSPDGDFYYLIVSECNCVKFFKTKTNTLLTQYPIDKIGYPIGWVYTKSHLFAFSEDSYQKINKALEINGKSRTGTINGEIETSETFIYDIEKNIKVQEFDGLLQSSRRLEPLVSSKKYLITLPVSYSKNKVSSFKSLANKDVKISSIPREYSNEN